MVVKKIDGKWVNIIISKLFFPGTRKCRSCKFHWLPQPDNTHPICPACGFSGDIVTTFIKKPMIIKRID